MAASEVVDREAIRAALFDLVAVVSMVRARRGRDFIRELAFGHHLDALDAAWASASKADAQPSGGDDGG